MAKRVKKSSGTADAGRGSDIVMARLPDGLKARITALAEANGRSMNSEIIDAILQHLDRPTKLDEIASFVEKYRKTIERVDEIIDWLEGDLYQDIENLKSTVSTLDEEANPLKYERD